MYSPTQIHKTTLIRDVHFTPHKACLTAEHAYTLLSDGAAVNAVGVGVRGACGFTSGLGQRTHHLVPLMHTQPLEVRMLVHVGEELLSTLELGRAVQRRALGELGRPFAR